jgi:hypothetical protein
MRIVTTIVCFLFFLINISSQSTPFLTDCKNDKEKFCKEINQPKSKIVQCLLEHNDDLSESCISNIKTFSDKFRSQGRGACKEDVDKFCKWIVPGGGRIIKCLFKNEASLSDACKKTLNE